jgi:NTP pyrophosphatase (non-canonical NTP hydrolase)
MTPNEYQQEAQRTALKSYRKLGSIAPGLQQLIHAHFGMSSETGEIGDALKKHLIYCQPLDVENLVEECGDLLWYISMMLTAADVTFEECMKGNIEKLRIRYPEKFTEELAKERLDKV